MVSDPLFVLNAMTRPVGVVNAATASITVM
jgi:hypothetical protein